MIRSSFIRAWVKPKIWTRILVQALFQTMPKIKKIVTFAELLKNDTGSCLKTVPYCSLMQKEPIERYSIPVSPYCLVPFHLYRYRYVFFIKNLDPYSEGHQIRVRNTANSQSLVSDFISIEIRNSGTNAQSHECCTLFLPTTALENLTIPLLPPHEQRLLNQNTWISVSWWLMMDKKSFRRNKAKYYFISFAKSVFLISHYRILPVPYLQIWKQ